MFCHVSHAGRSCVAAVPDITPSVPVRLPGSFSGVSRLRVRSMTFLLSTPVSFLSPAGGGTLIRAYPARVRARVGAGAVRAPDCPGTPPRASRTKGARLPSASRGSLRADANAGGLRMTPAAPYLATSGAGVKQKRELFLNFRTIPVSHPGAPSRPRVGTAGPCSFFVAPDPDPGPPAAGVALCGGPGSPCGRPGRRMETRRPAQPRRLLAPASVNDCRYGPPRQVSGMPETCSAKAGRSPSRASQASQWGRSARSMPGRRT